MSDEGWRGSVMPCPDCGAETLVADWWDDLYENGGRCIGTKHKCTNPDCDWFERF